MQIEVGNKDDAFRRLQDIRKAFRTDSQKIDQQIELWLLSLINQLEDTTKTCQFCLMQIKARKDAWGNTTSWVHESGELSCDVAPVPLDTIYDVEYDDFD